ncbi:hypothetical protein Thimo_3063 [Thioflavicoccus mobilis 8321]|uniref:Uncharacterized protein n=1 Tax=Thioflavicoccus mobilis 8321 TaxID=765912 RepID=L0H273_9GAMM|nr:hypothetical protein [Thioflavicoccus mobilis]AGA91750.1 hypothetical protein Thimo_3063 [Thioflavicoccus mobilis 8321]
MLIGRERQHSPYLAGPSKYGKAAFPQRLECEIVRATQRYPNARYLRIVGGACNWRFDEQHTAAYELIDFFHATEYLGKLPQRPIHAATPRSNGSVSTSAHVSLLFAPSGFWRRLLRKVRDEAIGAWSGFTYHRPRMDHPDFLAVALFIGPGVTEAVCKTLVKQRLSA